VKARIVLSHQTIKVLTPKSKKGREREMVPFATKVYPDLQTTHLVKLPNCWYNTFPSRTYPSSDTQMEHQKDAEAAKDCTFKKLKDTKRDIYSATFNNVSPSFPLVVYSR
jgi:hypothetical protein